MATPLLMTKLYIPPARSNLVPRPNLVQRLDEGLQLGHKLTLISAPAGFGKTTLLSEWLHGWGGSTGAGTAPLQVAWLSLDEGDNDLARFLTYLVAALQTIEGNVGQGVLAALQSPGAVNVEAVLTTLINEIAGLRDSLILVLDDYHVIESQPVDNALTFFLDHLPPPPGGLHLVIASRSDPSLPLSRLRAGGQMTEIRVADLRFTHDEVAAFLTKATGLELSAENVAALETRTEGWIAGLQLAALSMQRFKRGGDVTDFVNRFTGSDRYIQDYLADEVLQQRPQGTKDFLLQTSILNRLSGPLCDAVTNRDNSQAILEALEAANLFIVPLDNERRWYRYHHLFADLLRQRLQQSPPPLSSPPTGGKEEGAPTGEPALPALARPGSRSRDPARAWRGTGQPWSRLGPTGACAPGAGRTGRAGVTQAYPSWAPGQVSLPKGKEGGSVAELHKRASQWYEENGLEIEAFHHAAAANDVERAARLVEGEGMPLQFRGAVAPVLNWLASLPATVLDARPSLWVMYASALSMTGQTTGVEEKLQAAEAALQGAEPDDKTRNLVGHIAAIRALLAATQNQVETIIAQSRRALEYLHPDNLAVRTATIWKLGIAYQLQGERAAASQAYTEAISISQASGNIIINISATTGLGNVQEAENQLYLAAETYRRVLRLAGDQPQPAACEAHLGLARVLYEWNDLDAAQQHGQQGVQLARQLENIDRFVACEVFLARLKLAQGDVASAAAILAEAGQSVRQHNFVHRMPEVAAAQVLTLLRQGNLAAAAHLAQAHELPISQARVHLAQGDTSAALAALEPLRQQAEAKGWQDERLKVMILQAVALHAHGEKGKAAQLLGDALALAEPGGFIRIFVDEGPPMARLLYDALSRGIAPDYVRRLLAVFPVDEPEQTGPSKTQSPEYELIEPLSERELEVLQLIAEGLTNPEIATRLYLSLNTVKVHTRNIYGKLGVNNRTQAGARASALGILPSN
jgi:LuxR family maltose regulon positive regulatory protein